jgi:hypothetical protein
MLKFYDRIRETCTASGNTEETFTLTGAVDGYNAHPRVDGEQCHICILDTISLDWEVWLCTYDAGNGNFIRDEMFSSSNATMFGYTRVDFSPTNAKEAFLVLPAREVLARSEVYSAFIQANSTGPLVVGGVLIIDASLYSAFYLTCTSATAFTVNLASPQRDCATLTLLVDRTSYNPTISLAHTDGEPVFSAGATMTSPCTLTGSGAGNKDLFTFAWMTGLGWVLTGSYQDVS